MQNAASRGSRVAARGGAKTRSAKPVVHLNLPTSAIPRDIRRVAEKAGVTGGYEVQINYFKYRPDGRAFMLFGSMDEASRAASRLDRTVLCGSTMRAFNSNRPIPLSGSGSGPNAGLKEVGRTVLIEGLPKIWGTQLAEALARERFTVEDTADSTGIKRAAQESDGNGGSSWLVRLNTAAEAHRLIRRYHMTVMDNNEESLVQARIIY